MGMYLYIFGKEWRTMLISSAALKFQNTPNTGYDYLNFHMPPMHNDN